MTKVRDLLLFSRPLEAVYTEILELAAEKEGDKYLLPSWEEDRYKESAGRIQMLREKAARLVREIPVSLPSSGRDYVDSPKVYYNPEVYYKVAVEAVRIVRDPGGLLPLSREMGIDPIFCGEEKDFNYYVVRRFILRILESLEKSTMMVDHATGRDFLDPPESELDALFERSNLGEGLEAVTPGTGELIKLYFHRPLETEGGGPPGGDRKGLPGSDGKGSPVIFLLGRRAVSPQSMLSLVENHQIVIPCG